jgi:flagellar hook-associated protein 3 FlgL
LEKISFFQSVDEFVSALESGDRSNVQRAIGEMDELGQSVNLGLANLGARQVAIDRQQSLVSETRLRLQETLSNIQDLDYASAVTKLNQQMLALESGMNSFAKLSQLNLFSILR